MTLGMKIEGNNTKIRYHGNSKLLVGEEVGISVIEATGGAEIIIIIITTLLIATMGIEEEAVISKVVGDSKLPKEVFIYV